MGSLKNIAVLIFLIISQCVLAQKPTVTSVSKVSGSFSTSIIIKGSEFGTDASKLKVYFGPVIGTIKTVSNQLLEVTVPAGTAYENIAVINTSNGLIGYSNTPFQLSFNGTPGLAASNFGTEFQTQTSPGLYDLALGDFDNDGLPDVVAGCDLSNTLNLFKNGSTVGVLSLTKSTSSSLSTNRKTFHVITGDLNGDGRIDIVASEGEQQGSLGNRVFIYRNNGSFNFTAQEITITGRKVKRIAIADLDLDGKPEIIFTNKAGNTVTVLPNQSNTTSILFGSSITVTIAEAVSTDGLEVKDINGDGSPEILVSQFNQNSSNIFIISNKSTPGNFNLSDIKSIPLTSQVTSVRLADLDGDKKPDLVITRFLDGDLAVFRNTSTATQHSFAARQLFKTSPSPFGIDFGDLDGDGKLDIVANSTFTTDGTLGKTISILNNTSTPGTIAFADVLALPTNAINRHVKIADMDGDAKPDIVFVSVDDSNKGNGNSIPNQISIFRNKTCVTPIVIPSISTTPLVICTGTALQLNASNNPGTTYAWKNGANAVGGNSPQLTITASGNYSVAVTSEGGTCTASTAQPVAVTVSTASATLSQTPSLTSNAPVCTGGSLQLSINNVGASEYRWSGPGYTSNVTTLSADELTPFTSDNAGIYSVDIVNGGTLAGGGCIAQTVTTAVGAVDIPTFTVSFSGADSFCSGGSKLLSVSPVLTSSFDYKWFNASGALNGETNPTYTANASGDYYAEVKSKLAGCDAKKTTSTKITVLSIPSPKFSVSPAPSCSGTELTFSSDQSTVDPKAPTPTYSWTFGDNTTSNLQSPKHTYLTGQTYDIFFTIDYTGLTGCTTKSKVPITVVSAVKPVISSPGSGICAGESKALKIEGAFNTITWNDNTKGSTLTITQSGTYSANTVDANGCVSSAQLVVALKPSPTVVAATDKTSVTPGQIAQLTATGADTYSWTPIETLDNAAISVPKAMPIVNTTYKVKGTLTNGCSAEASIDILVDGDQLTLMVSNIFTPNGDGLNDMWRIPGIQNYPDCTLSLFDKNGSKVFEQKGYADNTAWDGNYKGQSAPVGTYYYVIGCPDKKSLTGSLLLAR